MRTATRRATVFGGNRASTASWQVVTTGAATHTIAAFTVSASTVVDWGDGSVETFTGAGARTHNYAGAGTWTVRVMQPLNVTALTLSDNQVVLNSAGVASMTNMATFDANTLKAGTFNSADVAAWRPTAFQLSAMPAGYVINFNSSNVAAWRPTTFQLSGSAETISGTFNFADIAEWRPTTYFIMRVLAAGLSVNFNSSNVAAWRPPLFYLHTIASLAATITASDFAAWTTTTGFQMQGNALTQAKVDAILYGLYQASIAPRTGVNGAINVGGSNAAPSGTFQACASPPVTAATPGKEIAHELLNDTIGAFANHWATVTTS